MKKLIRPGLVVIGLAAVSAFVQVSMNGHGNEWRSDSDSVAGIPWSDRASPTMGQLKLAGIPWSDGARERSEPFSMLA